MRAFARHLLWFLIIQGCLWIGVLVLYRQYKVVDFTTNETRYFAAKIDKHNLLVQQSSPRIVFVGGSNLAFGLDSSEIERLLGYHPVNMGIHLGLGLDFMLQEVEPFLKHDDVVLMSPEYENFTDLYSGDVGTLFTQMEIQPDSIRFFTLGNLTLFLDQGLIVIGTITRRSASFGISVLKGEVQKQPQATLGPYQRGAFNQFGDVIAHRNLAPKDFQVDKYKPSTPASIYRVITKLNAFNNRCQHTGVLVFYSYPPLFQGQMQANADMMREIAFNLSQRLNFPLLDTPEEMSFPLDYFFDGPYHLNAFGTQIRTWHLIEKLRGKLAHHTT
jgi:hypothetical protein